MLLCYLAKYKLLTSSSSSNQNYKSFAKRLCSHQIQSLRRKRSISHFMSMEIAAVQLRQSQTHPASSLSHSYPYTMQSMMLTDLWKIWITGLQKSIDRNTYEELKNMNTMNTYLSFLHQFLLMYLQIFLIFDNIKKSCLIFHIG